MCVRACVRARVFVHACVCVCVCACMFVCLHSLTLYVKPCDCVHVDMTNYGQTSPAKTDGLKGMLKPNSLTAMQLSSSMVLTEQRCGLAKHLFMPATDDSCIPVTNVWLHFTSVLAREVRSQSIMSIAGHTISLLPQ